jgi:hypothetical protein
MHAELMGADDVYVWIANEVRGTYKDDATSSYTLAIWDTFAALLWVPGKNAGSSSNHLYVTYRSACSGPTATEPRTYQQNGSRTHTVKTV